MGAAKTSDTVSAYVEKPSNTITKICNKLVCNSSYTVKILAKSCTPPLRKPNSYR